MKGRKEKRKLVRVNRHIYQDQIEVLDRRQQATGIPSAKSIRDAIDLLIKLERLK